LVRAGVRGRAALSALLAVLACVGGSPATAGPRVFSIGQCADQYVLAMAPRGDIVGLSYRAGGFDSYMRDRATGLPLRRPSLEAILASRAQLVVRYWPQDERLARELRRRGVRIVTIEDANDFNAIRVDIRAVAAALGQAGRGEALIMGMDRELADARGAWDGTSALYLTSGGFTAGRDTLVGAMMTAAGMDNLAKASFFAPAPLEQMALHPPQALVLGFFDRPSLSGQPWAFGRHELVQRLIRERAVAYLSPTILGCPAWFAADGARDLAAAARRRSR